ncbi:unnamed protein product [marine sediment metagenome]|uniref:Methyltransferase type 11 domain-containing protein n=1 Tax=marine sediment metagenome TaxID=412755 RepID=X0W3W4_9ZZZZ
MKREEIFRNTNKIYLGWQGYASDKLLRFATRYAGKRILDVGCSIGDYCLELSSRRFDCVGVDYNEEYVKEAKSRGVKAYVMDAYNLGFEDKSFDTVLLFEVLEHVEKPELALLEAKRLARRNILITTPNFSEYERLASVKLTYYDVLTEDHVIFFTEEELLNLCKKVSSRCTVIKKEPIYMHRFLPLCLRKPISILYRTKLLKPVIYRRLYALVWLEG